MTDLSEFIDPSVAAQRRRLRRVRASRRLVGAPAPVRAVRARRMLRRLRSIPTPTKHYESTGHRVIRSYEPGEEWFWDYVTDDFSFGPRLAPPESHPPTSPSPGPADRVPANWQDLLAANRGDRERALSRWSPRRVGRRVASAVGPNSVHCPPCTRRTATTSVSM